MPIPKSKRVHVGEPHVVKPDLDNLIKSAVDPLNGVFWKDDNLVHLVNARKVYSESPGIEYIINY
jgi:Holliday junction resolvase RusA-like endonuclease